MPSIDTCGRYLTIVQVAVYWDENRVLSSNRFVVREERLVILIYEYILGIIKNV